MDTQARIRNLRDTDKTRKHLRFRRRKQIEADTGMPRSTLYDAIRRGVWPPPIRLGANSVAWLDHESQAVIAARAAGKSDDQIRGLVKELVAARSEAI